MSSTSPMDWIQLIVYGLGALVLLLWLFLPFAVFGTKRLLREQGRLLQDLLAEQRRANELLYRLSIEEPAEEPRASAPALRGEPAIAGTAPPDPDAGRREPALEAGRTRASLVADRSERLV